VVKFVIFVSGWVIVSLGAEISWSQSPRYGPEVKAFLSLLKQEEQELEFQLKNREISRSEYVRSRNRIEVHRGAVLSHARKTGEDSVPEYHVVTVDEVELLIREGETALKGLKPGSVIKEKWRYVGSATRGELFHIIERLSEN
jgi:hypothetical protein